MSALCQKRTSRSVLAMSAEIYAVTFKLSTSRACDFVGAASARAVATTLDDRVSSWFGRLTGQLMGQFLSERMEKRFHLAEMESHSL